MQQPWSPLPAGHLKKGSWDEKVHAYDMGRHQFVTPFWTGYMGRFLPRLKLLHRVLDAEESISVAMYASLRKSGRCRFYQPQGWINLTLVKLSTLRPLKFRFARIKFPL